MFGSIILVSQATLRQINRISSWKVLHKLLSVVLVELQRLLLDSILFTDHIIVATRLQLLVYVHIALLEHVLVLIDLVLLLLLMHHLLMHLLRWLAPHVCTYLSDMLAVSGRSHVLIARGCYNSSAISSWLHALRGHVFCDAARGTWLLFNLVQLIARLINVGKPWVLRWILIEKVTAMWTNHRALLLVQGNSRKVHVMLLD